MFRSFKDSFETSDLLGGGGAGMLPNKSAGRVDNGVKLNTVNKSVLLTIAWSLASLCIMYVLVLRICMHVHAFPLSLSTPMVLTNSFPAISGIHTPHTHVYFTRTQVLRLRTLLAVQLHVQVHVPEGVMHLH